MRSRKPFLIFWPQYFDGKRSRSNGRRLPKKFALDKITTSDITNAAKRLGYNAVIEKGYKYPKTWWDDPGRVVIDGKGKKKSKILLEIAKELRKSRSKS
ncbi:MAG: signal recognition particle subunit SRP19/SEC65 family protein [Candidatus Thorarchaeota archaeon]